MAAREARVNPLCINVIEVLNGLDVLPPNLQKFVRYVLIVV